MYSYYVLHQSSMTSNSGDTLTHAYVLSDPGDVRRAIDEVADECHDGVFQLRVYQRDRLVHAIDLHGRAEVAIPPLEGTPLPPGHPVMVDGEPLRYGYTTRYP